MEVHMAYAGYLVMVGSTILPNTFCFKESYKINANARIDLDSNRNSNGVLMRNVLDHTVTKITILTKPMWDDDLEAMMQIIRSNFTSQIERKVTLTYYCPDLNDYRTGQFYVPDLEFPILRILETENKIMYKSFELKFIEY